MTYIIKIISSVLWMIYLAESVSYFEKVHIICGYGSETNHALPLTPFL